VGATGHDIRAACVTMDSVELQTRLLQIVQEAVKQPYDRLEIVPLSQIPNLAYSKIKILTTVPRSRVAIELSGLDCETNEKRVTTIWFKLHAWRELWVYGRNANAEQSVLAASPKKQMLDVAALQLSEDEIVEKLADQWLRQMVNMGTPILKRHLEVEPLVKKNEIVTVIVQGNGLMIQTKGVVLQKGNLGVTVPVLVNGAVSSTSAVVTAKGEVHVEI